MRTVLPCLSFIKRAELLRRITGLCRERPAYRQRARTQGNTSTPSCSWSLETRTTQSRSAAGKPSLLSVSELTWKSTSVTRSFPFNVRRRVTIPRSQFGLGMEISVGGGLKMKYFILTIPWESKRTWYSRDGSSNEHLVDVPSQTTPAFRKRSIASCCGMPSSTCR